MNTPQKIPPRLTTRLPMGGLQHVRLPYPMTLGETALALAGVVVIGALPLWPMLVLGAEMFAPGPARLLPAAAWLFVLAPLLVRVLHKRLAARPPEGRWGQYDAQEAQR